MDDKKRVTSLFAEIFVIQRFLTVGKNLWITVSILLCACSTPPYARQDGPTAQLSDNAVRYGSIAGLGGAGYLAGRGLGGNQTAGAVGAATGVVAGIGLNKFFDSKRRSAYQTGYDEGEDAARAEIVNEKWRREAIYGLQEEGGNPPPPIYREVYVPSHEINGVKMQGEYQSVQVLK
jgi:hypothetical protein